MLAIAKLDWLAFKVHFVSGPTESEVEFVAADMPIVNWLTVYILAVVGEKEVRMISTRATAALSAAKARVRPSNPNLCAGKGQARVANAVKGGSVQVPAAGVLLYNEQARRAGASTQHQLADALASPGVPTPIGRGAHWHPTQADRLERRVAMRP